MKRAIIAVDVEADGPVPHLYSMISLGAVVVEPGLARTFYAQMMPSGLFVDLRAEAIGRAGWREDVATDSPGDAMVKFRTWLATVGTEFVAITDNPGFDMAYINFYSHKYLNYAPLGHSARRINDYWAGLQKNLWDTRGWKKKRTTRHTHNALDDAMGLAEAALALGFGVPTK